MLRQTLLGLGAAIALGSSIQNAHAQPLLADNSGIKVNEILTLYPDHEDPNLVHFMPNSSGVAYDPASGSPQLGFVYWGLSNGGPIDQAGAWLSFTMRLKSDEVQKKALQSLLDEGKRIAVLPVQKSTIGLSSTKEGMPLEKFFEEFNFSEKAGLAESEVGVNAVLNGLGAKVFKKAFETPQGLKMDYCYLVQGLGPVMDAKIHVKWDKVYDHFAASFSTGFLARKTIQVEIEKLKQENMVSIEVNGGDASDREKIDTLTRSIIDRLFVPELKMQPGSVAGGGFGFSRFSLSFTHKEELKEETWTIKHREKVEREFCANMKIEELSKYKDKIIKDADQN